MKETLLIQKMSGGAVRATSEWGIEVTSNPLYPRGLEVKDLPSNNWHDEHGLDEYIPDVLPVKEYTITIGLVYRGQPYTGAAQVEDFLSFLTNGGSNRIYSTRLRQGRQDVRFKSFERSGAMIDSGCDDVIIFTITMQVNDPITNITLEQSNG